ncbi:MAG: hypothetical protein WC475_04515 [Candidatus Paceibacterota bacterium]
MPSINIYTNDKKRIKPLEHILSEFRDFAARELSCGDRTLASNEISLRILMPEASMQIADTEIEMSAYHYPERVRKQDDICLSVKKYIEKNCPQAGSVYVWLSLSELGHSFKD